MGFRNKKIKDEIVHKKLCYFNRKGNVWTPYTLAQLTREHISVMALLESQEARISWRDAKIASLENDVERLKKNG